MIACLVIPGFELRTALRSRPNLALRPAALAPAPSGEGNAVQAVGAVTAAAEAAGVRPGMRLGEALALCPPLVLVEADPAGAEQAWEAILERLEDAGIAVSPVQPGTAFFETRGVERLYGGVEAVLKRALAAVGPAWDARLGAAERKFTALAAATIAQPGQLLVVSDERTREFLAPLPLDLLPLEEETQQELKELGVRRLGELAGLPGGAVAERLGPDGRRAWSLARGGERRRVRGRRPPAELVGQLELVQAAGAELDTRLSEGLRQVRSSTGSGSVNTVVEVAPWSRIPEARALFVPRNEQGACFRYARPRRHLHDGVHRARPGAGAHLAQTFAETCVELRAGGLHELELLTRRLRELDELEPQLEHRRRQLRELRGERGAQPVALDRRLAQRQCPPPRGAADDAGRDRNLAREALLPFRTREQPVEQDVERAPERHFVADRLGKLEPLDELRGRAAAADAPPLAASRQAPGAPAVRPQTFGNGATRKPGKLSKPSHSQFLQLLLLLLAQREQVERQRREEFARALVRHDEQLPRPRDVRRGERRKLPLGRTDPRVPQRADGSERPLQRRLDAPVEPLHAARFEERGAVLGRRNSDPRILEPAQELFPFALGALRIGFDEDERRAERERLPQPHPRPDPGGLGGGRDRPQERLRSLRRGERCREQGQTRPAAERGP